MRDKSVFLSIGDMATFCLYILNMSYPKSEKTWYVLLQLPYFTKLNVLHLLLFCCKRQDFIIFCDCVISYHIYSICMIYMCVCVYVIHIYHNFFFFFSFLLNFNTVYIVEKVTCTCGPQIKVGRFKVRRKMHVINVSLFLFLLYLRPGGQGEELERGALLVKLHQHPGMVDGHLMMTQRHHYTTTSLSNHQLMDIWVDSISLLLCVSCYKRGHRWLVCWFWYNWKSQFSLSNWFNKKSEKQ